VNVEKVQREMGLAAPAGSRLDREKKRMKTTPMIVAFPAKGGATLDGRQYESEARLPSDLDPTLIRPRSDLNPALARLSSDLDPALIRVNPA
jgi:hypothetical protein